MLKQRHELMLGLLRVGDGVACLVAFALAWRLAPAVHPTGEFSRVMFSVTALAALLLYTPIYARLGLYSPQRMRDTVREISALFRAVALSWCLSYVAVSLLVPDRPSRVIMGLLLPTWLLSAGLMRFTGRVVLRSLRQRGWNLRHAAIVGTGRLAQTLHHTLKRNTWMGIEVSYFVHTGGSPATLLGKEAIGSYANACDVFRDRPIDMVFLALPQDEQRYLGSLLEQLSQTGLDVRVVPDMLSYNLLRHELEAIENLPVVNLTHTPMSGWNAVAKRGVDLCAAAVALVVLAPFMALIALAVRLTSPGPILYRQTRASLGGQPFRLLKFRTMVPDAERSTGAIWSHGQNDPRLTRIGHFLRRWNLDELPQFWNVLLGEMSLVGPRPERPELVERFGRKIPRYMLRQHAKAGLTGWAQVNGLRGRTSLRKRVQYDLFYLCNWSLGFDLKILAMTLNPFATCPEQPPVEIDDPATTSVPEPPPVPRLKPRSPEPGYPGAEPTLA